MSGSIAALKSTFRSLKYRNYRLFFAGQSISLIGTWIQRIAMPWLVYDITKSVVLLGIVSFIGQIPTFIVSPFAGVLTDRWNRYRIMIITQILSMIQAAVLTWLVLTGTIEVWHIIVLSGILGCINAFDIPARQAFVVQMVDKKADLANAIALNSSLVNGARLLGPSIAGILIATTGEGICFLLNTLSYIFVIASLAFMNVPTKINNTEHKPVLKAFRDGFVYTFGFIPIKYIILLLALISLTGIPYTVLMPVFVKEILHGGSHTFGFLIGASGFGALIGTLYLASRNSVNGLIKIIPLAAIAFGSGLVMFSLSRYFLLSFVLLTITGGGMMMQMASSNTMLQTIADDERRGRVMSFYTMAFMGTAPFGSLIAGYSAKIIGVPFTILIGGLSCIAGGLYFYFKVPYITKFINKNI